PPCPARRGPAPRRARARAWGERRSSREPSNCQVPMSDPSQANRERSANSAIETRAPLRHIRGQRSRQDRRMPPHAPLLQQPRPREQHEKLEGGRRLVMATHFEPAGDQPQAIEELAEGVLTGEQDQVLLGATGTGKTFTMAKVIEATQR